MIVRHNHDSGQPQPDTCPRCKYIKTTGELPPSSYPRPKLRLWRRKKKRK